MAFSILTRAGVHIRYGRPGDGPAAYAVFYAAVHEGAAAQYSEAERSAWAPSPVPPDGWEDQLLAGVSLVACNWAGRVLGFMTLGEDGFIDLAYVRPDMRRGKLAKLLYSRLESEARARAITQLNTDASHLFRAFLMRRGWQTDARQGRLLLATTSKGGGPNTGP